VVESSALHTRKGVTSSGGGFALSEASRYWVLPSASALLREQSSSPFAGAGTFARCTIQIDVDAVARSGVDACSPVAALGAAMAAVARVISSDSAGHASDIHVIRKVAMLPVAEQRIATMTCEVDAATGSLDVGPARYYLSCHPLYIL
jgi:hypothetical protein